MKNLKKILILSFLVLLFITKSTVFAETGSTIKTITLSEAFSIADRENLDLISVKKNVDVANEDIKIAKQRPNPQIQPLFGFGKVYSEQGNPNAIAVNQLFELGKRGPRINVAKANYNLTSDTVKLNAFDLHSNIRQSYINLVAAKSELVILNEQRIQLENLVDIARKRFNAGAIPESDLLEAKLVLNQTITQINQATSQVLQARIGFNNAININGNNDVIYDVDEVFLPQKLSYISIVRPKTIQQIPKDQAQNFPSNKKFNIKVTSEQIDSVLAPSPTKSLPALAKLEDIALKQRLDLKVAKDQVESLKKSLILAKRMRIPDVNMSVGYNYDYTDVFGMGNKKFYQGVYIAPTVTLPILNNQGPQIRKNIIQLEQASLQLEALKRKAFSNIKTDHEQLEVSQLNLLIYKNNLLEESSNVVKMSQKRYEVGKTNLSSVILVQQEYQSILTGYANSLISYYSAWGQLLRDIGEVKIPLYE